MSFFTMSRLASLDVRWAGIQQGNDNLYMMEHSNPFFELMVVAEGPIYLQVESEQLELNSGDIFILKPWERHYSWKKTNPKANFFWVQFSCTPSLKEVGDLASGIDYSLLEHQDLRTFEYEHVDELILPRHFQFPRPYELLSQFEKLLETFSKPEVYFRFRSTLQFAQILESIALSILVESKNQRYIPESFVIYRKLVRLLDEAYTDNLSKEEIERSMDRTYEYLCQIFKKYSGTNIIKYTNMLKIQKAKFLLKSTNRSVQEISQDVGISDTFYFSKLFKQYEKISPTAFRERMHPS
ncbi:AraC family transcriptional regulator [Paenibacillus sp. FSL K6-3182]|uniref:AraC family transcriptional regulator n=1 Tax=Paenibacillus sp. FSL K6-3182 TaxID=2921495 RepID=UPI0030CCB239